MDIKTASDTAYEYLNVNHSFDLENHLKTRFASSVRPRIPVFLRMIEMLFDNYQKIKLDLENNDEMVKLRLFLSVQILYGKEGKADGIKQSFELFFNMGEFRRNDLNKEMVAEYFIKFIELMANDIDSYSLQQADYLQWSDKALNLIDLSNLVEELLEIPRKYQSV